MEKPSGRLEYPRWSAVTVSGWAARRLRKHRLARRKTLAVMGLVRMTIESREQVRSVGRLRKPFFKRMNTMASLLKRKNGAFSVRFVDPTGQPRTLAIGTKSESKATEFKGHLESLLWALENTVTPDPKTLDWLTGLSDKVKAKMAAMGLARVEGEQAGALTLGAFLDSCVTGRTGSVKASTMTVWHYARQHLEVFFGKDKPLAEITAGDAADFERYLRTKVRKHERKKASKGNAKPDAKVENLRPSTIRKRISIAKLFFNDAVDRKLIESNPFAKLKSATKSNRDRDYFITPEVAVKVIEAAPDAEWRVIIALARFGGLRTPSETFALRWSDIDWANNRMTVHSPKTEHHEGQATRITPLFAELRTYLEDLHDIAPERTEFVVNRYRNPGQNLRTQFERIIGRAGLTPWPKLFQNLRASRATELAEMFPGHVAAAWLGHSEKVADRHYRQVTEEHFERAKAESEKEPRAPGRTLKGAQGGVTGENVSAETLYVCKGAQGEVETVASHRFEL